MAVDWIVPGDLGDEAPLAAAATDDALQRLRFLQRPAPATWRLLRRDRVHSSTAAPTLRIAHGLPVGDYIGTSIELKPARGGPFTATLLLVERIPAGTVGSASGRLLVRDMLHIDWPTPTPAVLGGHLQFYEFRPLSIPQGSQRERLSLVGWVENAQGDMIATAQTRCPNEAAPATPDRPARP